MNPKLQRQDLVYPELSYKIIGVLLEVYKELSGNYQEKYYQRVVSLELKKRNLKFVEQSKCPLSYKGQNIGNYALDFLVEDVVVVELKKDKSFSFKDIEQVYNYLKAYDLKLGILANFTSEGLKFKRILNQK